MADGLYNGPISTVYTAIYDVPVSLEIGIELNLFCNYDELKLGAAKTTQQASRGALSVDPSIKRLRQHLQSHHNCHNSDVGS